ncbi:MAG: AEC family transporter [Burkholderiaceae bacterium]|jgi:malonate transporter
MSVFQLILPDFILISLGWLLYRRLNFGAEFFKSAEKLVYFLLFPSLLFYNITRSPLDFGNALSLFQAIALLMMAGIVIVWAAKPLLKPQALAYASLAQCAYRFNTYIALSLAGTLAGPEGATTMAVLIGFAVPIANIAAVQSLARHGAGNPLREIAQNPLILGTVAGLAWNFSGLPVHDVVATTLSRLGSCALAIGLICVGASLSLQGINNSRPMMAWVLVLKLAITPVLALIIGAVLQLSHVERQILLLFSALPTAPSAYVLAVRMGGDGRLVAVTVTLGTLLSALTIPLWLLVGSYFL